MLVIPRRSVLQPKWLGAREGTPILDQSRIDFRGPSPVPAQHAAGRKGQLALIGRFSERLGAVVRDNAGEARQHGLRDHDVVHATQVVLQPGEALEELAVPLLIEHAGEEIDRVAHPLERDADVVAFRLRQHLEIAAAL